MSRRWRLIGTALVAAIVIAAFLYYWSVGRAPQFVEYRLPVRTDIPAAIAVGPDSAVWFTIEMSNALGVLRNGRIERLTKTTPNLEALGLAVDTTGRAWYTDSPGRSVGRMSADGRTESFRVATPIVKFGRLAVAGDDGVWFADATTASITRLKDGVFTRHDPRSAGGVPWGVATAADGTVWATLQHVNRLARVAANGEVTEFEVPTRGAGLSDVAVDGRGAVWFLMPEANKIGRFADGRFAEFAVPTPSSGLTSLAVAPDGAAWFTQLRAGGLGRVRDGRLMEFRLPRTDARPFGVAVDRANNVWYTDLGGWVGMLPARYASGR